MKEKITLELDHELLERMREMCSKIGVELTRHIELTLKLDFVTYDTSSPTKHNALKFLVDKDIYRVVSDDETKGDNTRNGEMTLFWKQEYWG